MEVTIVAGLAADERQSPVQKKELVCISVLAASRRRRMDAGNLSRVTGMSLARFRA
jgi:hypothetical protein